MVIGTTQGCGELNFSEVERARFFPDDSPPEAILGHGESGEHREGFKHTSFQKREIAFVLLMIWWAVQDSNLRPPACKAGGNSI